MSKKISIAIAFDEAGNPSLLKLSTNADECLNAYRDHEGDAVLFVRPVPSKSKCLATGLVLREETAEPVIESEPTEPTDPESNEIQELREIAQGDKRKAEVKAALERLKELGIEE